ncbi:hypothetical protein N0V93_006746 [Gnomoniopsis smithogilvyi]|uniref:Uncharacterized protein n=1 Tax=Gnomoniopsis smithogilvyi TaxID=1191159 RepID=A0A9W8YQB1_9PEZI|nr:hypothetical protein N0V93_006746 [Gnomoniopsis smithogilvyi]
MWASGRPYHFNKKTTQATTTTTLSSTRTTYQTSHTETLTSKPATPSAVVHGSLPVTNDITPSHPSGASCQIDFRSALNRIPTPWAELARYTKIVRRLKWKLPFLAYAYNAAIDRTVTEEQRGEAELMFKLDFFEYYMLVERALVHLLGVFGVKITGAFDTRLGNENHATHGRVRAREGWTQSDHRFHANVLEALDDARNPLHEALGNSDARFALARAKELRNRWKNADEPDAILSARLPNGSKNTRPLEEYDLERILETIFAGFDKGFQTAEQYVLQVRAFAAERGESNNVEMIDDRPDEWEFMTDAMDWEAV